ncbi:unnamed protein product [Ilex paraguariensis]|uniref:Uncharacterized protein n=1 Tax=Ilex paraguariensis TaxID=185542 RepID=A0ABC8S581_9AQUA
MEHQSVQSESNSHIEDNTSNNHGWQKVTYAKRQRKTLAKPAATGNSIPNGSSISGGETVFTSLEKQSEERRRRIEAQRAAVLADVEAPVRLSGKKRDDDYEEGDETDSEAVENGKLEEKKLVKAKKPKKPKVTVAEAAAKIDAADLVAFLADIMGSYESQEEILLMRFADYFGQAFSAVNASQFPWLKLFRESTVAKIADIPVSHISEAVYKTSIDWINQRSYEALRSFVLWLLDSILADVASQQAGPKGSKKGVQQTFSKSQVAIFLVLAMVLRRKPDVLIHVFPKLKENSKYQGQDKLPVIVWMIAQVNK